MPTRKMNRGLLSKASRAKRLALIKRQDLSDLPTNTRKRRRLARRLANDQPLFAFNILRSHIPGYELKTFIRDSRKTKGFRSRPCHRPSARVEMHDELIQKIHSGDSSYITRLHLNWENRKKPFTFSKLGVVYTFSRTWSISKIRACSREMMEIQTVEELDKYWSAVNSFGF